VCACVCMRAHVPPPPPHTSFLFSLLSMSYQRKVVNLFFMLKFWRSLVVILGQQWIILLSLHIHLISVIISVNSETHSHEMCHNLIVCWNLVWTTVEHLIIRNLIGSNSYNKLTTESVLPNLSLYKISGLYIVW
jgi:hypothetical protein